MKPIHVGSIILKNRYAFGPLGSGAFLSGPKGEYTNNAIEYTVERARGGFGLITMGSIYTDMEVNKPDTSDNILGPAFQPKTFRRAAYILTDRVHVYGTRIFAQLAMGPGRVRGEKSPSVLPLYSDPTKKTFALTGEEIESKIASEVRMAPFIKDCGFDGVEIHAMHWGYLLDQFAMAITNQRTDEYGGTLEKRLTVVRKIVEGIKHDCGPSFPVSIRLGLKSYMKGFNRPSLTGEEEAGRTLEEGVRIAKLLESYGLDMLSVNSGVYDSFYYCAPPMYLPKGYNLHLAREAKKAVKIPVFTAGRMDDPDMCEKAITDGDTDGIVLARPTLADAHYARKVEMGCPEKIRPCISCENCVHTLFTVGHAICAVNPGAMKEDIYGVEKALKIKKVAVIGGGVAGMEAARIAKLRGHDVALYEKSNQLGGHLIEAGAHPFKDDINRLNKWYQQELTDLNIPIHLNTDVTAETIMKMGVQVAIFAVGSTPVMPITINGIDSAKSVSCVDALLNKKEVGKTVVVVGGGLVGAEMAYAYAKEGKQVTIVEALDKILSAGPPIPMPVKTMLIDLLDYYKVKIITGNKIEAINDKGAVISDTHGTKTELLADSVVIAIGFKPVPSIACELQGEGIEVYQIGDGSRVGTVSTAIGDAYEVARKL
jgi:2-enoate reductase